MREKYLPLPLSTVKKSNALARASWSVKSIYEPRLVALVASRVRADDQDFQNYEIPISELLESSSGGGNYKLISDVVNSLLGRVLTLPKSHGWVKCNIFSHVEYDGKNGVIRASFSPVLKPHYLNLKSHFTQYSLMEFLLLPSTYSQRLFEVLKSWSGVPETTIPIVDLYSMLDVPPSHRSDFAAFRRRVLEKAHRDITSKTGLYYEWESIKKGRAVDSIRFVFGRRKNKKVGNESTAKKQQKSSDRNNELFKRASDCWSHHVGLEKACEPQNLEHCKICRRFNWPKKDPCSFLSISTPDQARARAAGSRKHAGDRTRKGAKRG